MKYLAFFDTPEFAYENRSIDLASANVVEYTAEVLSRIDDVDIISPVRTLNSKGFYCGRKLKINHRISLCIPPTFGAFSKIVRHLSILWIQLWLLFFLLFKTKRKERIVVYHSLSIIWVIRFLTFFKKYKLTLEIREIYSDVLHLSERRRKKELAYFNLADNYIFPTISLNEEVNSQNKPYIIASGIYRDEAKVVEKFNDGKIHLIYAGTLDRLKSGALRSVRVAEFLDNDYVLHILGKGIPETLQDLKHEIKEIGDKTECKIIFDGELRGEEFKKYLQRCHIGLAVQDLSGIYNQTSFPSKILTYMANGLLVLCPEIPAIKESPIGKSLLYYSLDNPIDIAEAIKKINLKILAKTRLLSNLDKEFEINLRTMLNGK